ncbi:hypothetical protein FRC00_012483 [Tulasnella sp. 408]|nr:hypothetical protein FRC00_012483 [Tulasnella sp. 408]
MLIFPLVPVLGLVSPAGHKAVANVALHFLEPEVLATAHAILAADERKTRLSPSIVDVATWADEWAHKKGGVFSKPFHYIDAEDNPPFECNVVLERDCPESGCVVTAIANYTEQLVKRSGLNANVNDIADALKFLVHFLGDIAQPVHAEHLPRGKDSSVRWEGKMTSLHAVWDTSMIIKLAGPDTEENLDTWTSTIVNEINNGSYKPLIPEWLSCTDPSDALNCALKWVTDSNSFICTYVLKNDTTGWELSGSYYRGAVPIIQQQVAKGGLRLAAWLNRLLGSKELGEPPLFRTPLLIQSEN